MSDKQFSEEEKVEKTKVLSLNTFPCSAVTCSVQHIMVSCTVPYAAFSSILNLLAFHSIPVK